MEDLHLVRWLLLLLLAHDADLCDCPKRIPFTCFGCITPMVVSRLCWGERSKEGSSGDWGVGPPCSEATSVSASLASLMSEKWLSVLCGCGLGSKVRDSRRERGFACDSSSASVVAAVAVAGGARGQSPSGHLGREKRSSLLL